MAGNDAGVQDSADKPVSELSLCLASNSDAVSPQRYRLGVNRVQQQGSHLILLAAET